MQKYEFMRHLKGFLCAIGIALIIDVIITYGILNTLWLISIWYSWYYLHDKYK